MKVTIERKDGKKEVYDYVGRVVEEVEDNRLVVYDLDDYVLAIVDKDDLKNFSTEYSMDNTPE